jgi:dTDP-4-dehydrorhamnose reductase
MRVLVIGKQGQLARCLVDEASVQGVELASVGRPELELLASDTVDRAIDAFGPEVIVNAAAYTAVDRAEREADLAFAVNCEAVERLARSCAARGLPLVHISTDYVFDGRAAPYREEDATGPLSVYGRSKLGGEQRLREAHAQHVILRTAWVHSPYGTNFLKTMLRLGRERASLSIVSDQRGTPTYAPHLASAILAMCRRIAADDSADMWGTFHATGSGEATWHEFAVEIFRCARARGYATPLLQAIGTADYPTDAPRPADSRLDCEKLHRVFGLELPHWRDGTAACVEAVLGQDAGIVRPLAS